MSVVLWFASNHLEVLHINPLVIPETAPFLRVLALGLVPVFVFRACGNYLQAISRPLAPFVILVAANLFNVLFNWVFIFGKGGFPALGTTGCAVSTSLCRTGMAGALLGYLLWTERRGGLTLRMNEFRFRAQAFVRLVKLGTPASLQMGLEMGVFGLSTVLAGGLAAEALAAHQIVLNVASVTFMVPLGIGAATAVLVGHALGGARPREAAHMGWSGLGFSVVFMLLSGVTLMLFPTTILGSFSDDSLVLDMARSLLVIAALFQISDGMQTALTGALRGMGDTHAPVLANFVGHWLIGLPLSLLLCFHYDWGVSGIWVGLAVGLSVVATWLLLVWIARLRRSHFRLEHLTAGETTPSVTSFTRESS
jgi:MATE family multidrug resistance protein